MRKSATQKLAKAYRVDEIATSVATMQAPSTVEDVAQLVLQRAPNDADAQYVHFFHTKIPSRHLAQCTSLDELTEVLNKQPEHVEPLRTRATIRIFKDDYQEAVQDLTQALRIVRTRTLHSWSHEPSSATMAPMKSTWRRLAFKPTEAQQPTSLEKQLLFHRAGVYLTLACLEIPKALPPEPGETVAVVDPSQRQTSFVLNEHSKPSSITISPAQTSQFDARKSARHYAKRALRDLLAFFEQIDYSPNFPRREIEDFKHKTTQLVNKTYPNSSTNQNHSKDHENLNNTVKIYTLSELFSASSPTAELPPFPATKSHACDGPNAPREQIEILTYHPLLLDAMHQLLLVHAILQTSTTELTRHVFMVARLSSLLDGNPIFQASRSPARVDWIEVLHRTHHKKPDWLHLGSRDWAVLSRTSLESNIPTPFQPDYGAAKEEDLKDSIFSKKSVNAVIAADEEISEENMKKYGNYGQPSQNKQNGLQDQFSMKTQNTPLSKNMAAMKKAKGKAFTSNDTLIMSHNATVLPDMTVSGISTSKLFASASRWSGDEAPAAHSSTYSSGKDKLLDEQILDERLAGISEISKTKITTRDEENPDMHLDFRDLAILTERAAAVARWVIASPPIPPSGAKAKDRKSVV